MLARVPTLIEEGGTAILPSRGHNVDDPEGDGVRNADEDNYREYWKDGATDLHSSRLSLSTGSHTDSTAAIREKSRQGVGTGTWV